MKIICTRCGLVHTNRTTEHLKDRLCCFDTVRLVNYEIEEKVKAAYNKLYPLPCDCGSMITNQEPNKLCCRFTLTYAANGIKDKAEYEVEKDNHQEAKERGVEPIFKSLTSKRDMEIIHKMVRGETVKQKKYGGWNREYTITLNCAKVCFWKSSFGKGFYASIVINNHEDTYYERRTIREHAQQIGMKLACMFTN